VATLFSKTQTLLIQEKAAKLFGITRTLDELLGNCPMREEPSSLSWPSRIAELNKLLSDRCELVARAFPGVGLGYYDRTADAIVTYAPDELFGANVGRPAPPDHIGRRAMLERREIVGVGSMVRGDIMNCVRPIIREGEVFGFSWANETVEDIFSQMGRQTEELPADLGSIMGLAGILLEGSALLVSDGANATLTRDLKQFQETLRCFFKTIDVGMAVADLADRIIFQNGRLEELMAQGNLESATSFTELFVRLGAADLYSLFDVMAERGEEYLACDSPVVSPGGIELKLFLGLTGSNAMQGRAKVLLLEDLTKARQTENYRWRAGKLAAAGEIAAAVAHRMRNPLTIIKGAMELVPQKLNDPTFLVNMSQVASQELDGLNKTLESLLSLTKLSRTRFVDVDLTMLLKECVLLVAPYAENSQISIDERYALIPEIEADPQHLKQALIDLMVNAIQAMPGGGTLTVKTSHTLGSNLVEISVGDTGIGIDPKDQEQVFELFWSRNKEGTGLGLALVQRVVDEHQGFINLESKVGEGSIFRLTLPVHRY